MARSDWSNSGRGGGRGIVLPLLLIAVGSVLLLNNLGVLSWTVWANLAQVWPVVLVLVGIELVLGRRTPLLGFVLAAIVIAVAIGVVAHSTGGPGNVTAAPVADPGNVVAGVNQKVTRASPVVNAASQPHVDVPLGDAQSARVSLSVGAGDLRIGALPTGDASVLATADATLPNGVSLVKTVANHDGEAELTLATQGRGGSFWPFANHGQRSESLTVSLGNKVPLNLQTNLGAGQSDLDLTNLPIQTLDVNTGGGQTTIHFPINANQTRANIRSGAGQLTLIIPPDTGAYLHTTNGLVSVHVPSDRYTQVADGYQSDNYASAKSQIDIYVQMGVGQVDVQ